MEEERDSGSEGEGGEVVRKRRRGWGGSQEEKARVWR